VILPGIGKALHPNANGQPESGSKEGMETGMETELPLSASPMGRHRPRVGGERFSIFHTQPKTCELSKLTGARTNGAYSWLHSILPHDEAGICDHSAFGISLATVSFDRGQASTPQINYSAT
jgi:hypothetical protein